MKIRPVGDEIVSYWGTDRQIWRSQQLLFAI